MMLRKLFSAYEERCSKEADFANPGFCMETVFYVSKDIFIAIAEGFSDTIPKAHIKRMLLEALRFVYPGSSSYDDGNDRKWNFQRKEKADNMIRVLKTPCPATICTSPMRRK